jgi:16S rRNA (uracil1498-N3)-methyltransferase
LTARDRLASGPSVNLLLLLEQGQPGATVRLEGRQAQHVRKVLRARPGDPLRVGWIDGLQGTARVIEVQTLHVILEIERHDLPTPAVGRDVLVLAIPRPKVLLRCLEHATAIGYGGIVLLRTRRVDKNHMASGSFNTEAFDQRIVLGMEQARRTRPPWLRVCPRFNTFLHECEQWVSTANRWVAHPEAATDLSRQNLAPHEPHTLVIGPEGGLLDFEVEALQGVGFAPVCAGRAPLRVETALSFLSGCIWGLRRAAQPNCGVAIS